MSVRTKFQLLHAWSDMIQTSAKLVLTNVDVRCQTVIIIVLFVHTKLMYSFMHTNVT